MNQARIQKALLLLVIACGGVLVIATVFKQNAPLAIVVLVLSAILADGLLSREISFGRGSGRRRYSRRHQPLTYWIAIALYAIVLLFCVVALTAGKSKRKNEPNKAMETTPVAVTVLAYARTAPSTSVSHL